MSTAGAVLGIVLVTIFTSDLEEVNGACYAQDCRWHQSVLWLGYGGLGLYELLTYLRAKLPFRGTYTLDTVCIPGSFKDWTLSSHEKSGLISRFCFEKKACLETSWGPFYPNCDVWIQHKHHSLCSGKNLLVTPPLFLPRTEVFSLIYTKNQGLWKLTIHGTMQRNSFWTL